MKRASSKAVLFSREPAATPASATGTFQDRRSAPVARFTPRQQEVLALLCEGLPNKLICRALNIATGTVKVHISCILRELGVTSRLQAVVVSRARALTVGTAQ
jgi:DNA-binding NarL/FixJ family response regulator